MATVRVPFGHRSVVSGTSSGRDGRPPEARIRTVTVEPERTGDRSGPDQDGDRRARAGDRQERSSRSSGNSSSRHSGRDAPSDAASCSRARSSLRRIFPGWSSAAPRTPGAGSTGAAPGAAPDVVGGCGTRSRCPGARPPPPAPRRPSAPPDRTGVRRGHHRGLRHGLVLQQHALQLERRDPVVVGLEHVVRAPQVGAGSRPRRGARCRRCGSSRRRTSWRSSPRRSPVAGHHAQGGRRREADADLALFSPPAPLVRVDQRDSRSRAGVFPSIPAAPAASGLLPIWAGRLGLAVAVPHGHAPPRARTCSITSGVERLPHAARRSRSDTGPAGQVVADEHPPHRRRGAERRDPVQRTVQELLRVEPGVVM